MTQSVSFGVAVLVYGNGTSQGARFHLQSVSPPANKIVQHTRLASSLFIGVVLALLCFVLFNDCVQPCLKPKTIQPNSITDLDSLFASDRCNLHKVIQRWQGLKLQGFKR